MYKEKRLIKETLERFRESTKDHKMTVLLDNDIHRHLQFTKDGSGSSHYRFDLVTWGGFLTVCGDMGTYTFSRVWDMFTFFRSPEGRIDPKYYAEKLQQPQPEYKVPCVENFKQTVKEEFCQYWNFDGDIVEDDEGEIIQDFDPDNPPDVIHWCQERKEVWSRIREEVFSSLDEYSDPRLNILKGMEAIREFKHPKFAGEYDETQNFQDFWENNFDEYTFHFLWILHAIVWGINQYDEWKFPQLQMTEELAKKLAVQNPYSVQDIIGFWKDIALFKKNSEDEELPPVTVHEVQSYIHSHTATGGDHGTLTDLKRLMKEGGK